MIQQDHLILYCILVTNIHIQSPKSIWFSSVCANVLLPKLSHKKCLHRFCVVATHFTTKSDLVLYLYFNHSQKALL